VASFHELFEVSLRFQTPPRGLTLEGGMNVISEVSTRTVSKTLTNYTLNAIAVICGLGVVVCVAAATSGLDMSVGFF
jgi:hypothetical protein